MSALINFPIGPLVDRAGNLTMPWRLWLQSPHFVSSDVGDTGVTAGAYGSQSATVTFGVQSDGRLLTADAVPIAIDADQVVSGTFAAALMPGLTGDVSSSSGSISTTLATVNASPGSFGDAAHTLVATVNGKGLLTALAATPIAIASSQVAGTATNDNAAAGILGEYTEAEQNTGQSLTSGTVFQMVSITLTAGDWDVSGWARFNPAATTNVAAVTMGYSTNGTSIISNTSTQFPQFGVINSQVSFPGPVYRMSLSTTTTVYLLVQSSFTLSTMTAQGFIQARRVR